ncbi:MAG: ABC transporter ATP-binding protein [Actinomycetota bacterium]|nr:ABC transporter ATP-binding protein [Actinomycetota bacterium]
MESLLRTEDIHCGYYEDQIVIKGVSLSVGGGEFLGVIGPNGCGKSTLIKAICGILRSSRGGVFIGKTNLRDLSALEVARRIAVVPQDFHTEFAFTVHEIVSMGRSPHLRRFQSGTKADVDAIEGAMRATNSLYLAEKRITELSGGEKQRVIIAQALAQEPEILILDEPTSHLDINYQLEIMELARRLNGEGLTVLTVLHDLNLASAYCERLVLLNDGKVFADGSVDEVLTPENIGKTFGVDVIVHRNPLTGKLYITSIPKTYASSNSEGMRVHVICGSGTGAVIMHGLKEMGCRVSAGVLNVLDTDEEIAEKLGIQVVAEAPFSPISDEAFGLNMGAIEGADLVVLTNIPIGAGNFRNLLAAEKALGMGKRMVLVEETPMSERDYTEGRATRLLEKLHQRGAIIATDSRGVFEIVERMSTCPT